MREKFTFFRSYFDSLECVPMEIRDAVILAICRYSLYGEEPELSGVEEALFKAFKPNIDKSLAISDSASARGKIGGRPSEAKTDEKLTKANESKPKANESKTETNQKLTKANESKPKANKEVEVEEKYIPPIVPPKGVMRERFNTFWAKYPKKAAIKRAEKAFFAIKPSEELLKTMLDAIDKQSKGWNWLQNGGQYIPYPSTWLNGAYWRDEVASMGTASNSPSYRRPDYSGIDHRSYAPGELEALIPDPTLEFREDDPQ